MALGRWLIRFSKGLGPGLVSGVSNDDPSAIGTFSQTGAHFGYTQLWLALYSFPLMATVQEMCARIGIVTGEGLASVIGRHYPRWILYGSATLLLFANLINIGADLGAMAAVIGLLAGWPFGFWLLVISLVAVGLEVFVPYSAYARVLKYLGLSFLAYLLTAFIVPQDWNLALKSTLVPTLRLDPEYLMNAIAVLGTRISPYLFFWQPSQEVEEKIDRGETTLEERRHRAGDAREAHRCCRRHVGGQPGDLVYRSHHRLHPGAPRNHRYRHD